MGGAVRLAAARRARRLVRRRRRAARATIRCRVAVDTSDGPLAALVARVRPGGARPDQAQRRGARRRHRLLAAGAGSRRRPRRSRARRAGRPAAASTAASARCCHPRRRRRRAGRPTTAAGWPRRRRSPPRSTVGAGDCRLAGYLRADVGGADPPQRLQMAVAYGSAAAALPGSALPTPAQIDLDAVRVTPISPDPRSTRQSQPPAESIAMTSTASRPIINTDLVAARRRRGRRQAGGRSAGSSSRLADAGRATDADGLIAAAMAREEQSATGLPGGIAIPHCRSPHVDTGLDRLRPAATRRSTSARPTGPPIWPS